MPTYSSFFVLFLLLHSFIANFAGFSIVFSKNRRGIGPKLVNSLLPKARELRTERWNRPERLPPSLRIARCARFYITSFILLLPATSAIGSEAYSPCTILPPKVIREMRAVWIASVGNIDWPSTNELSTSQQKAELVALMDRAVALRLNTIILQVRPACDALYASSFEPWSEYLTGTMGRPPEPYYDPLAFAITEAHKRGLELHAWFNPYRARHVQAKSPISANHISRTHPEWVRHYGKSLWLDPGEKGVQEYSLRVVMDVVNRYDIDGVHFDDYFYPYKEQDAHGQDLEFPDWASWRRFGAGGRLSRDEWRRENVNVFVHRVYQSIKAAKPWVKFGISPFGIWRPGNPPQIKGFDAFAELHADSRKWLADGWVDYLAPQLYWAIAPRETSFPALLKWWTEQNPHGRLLCPGLKTYNVGRSWNSSELLNQIRLARGQTGISGHIHWSMKSLLQNGALDAALEREVYAEPALVPAVPWLEQQPPGKPTLLVQSGTGGTRVTWSPPQSDKVRLWVFQTQRAGGWSTRILPVAEQSVRLPAPAPEAIALTAIDRCGVASPSAVLKHAREE